MKLQDVKIHKLYITTLQPISKNSAKLHVPLFQGGIIFIIENDAKKTSPHRTIKFELIASSIIPDYYVIKEEDLQELHISNLPLYVHLLYKSPTFEQLLKGITPVVDKDNAYLYSCLCSNEKIFEMICTSPFK